MEHYIFKNSRGQPTVCTRSERYGWVLVTYENFEEFAPIALLNSSEYIFEHRESVEGLQWLEPHEIESLDQKVFAYARTQRGARSSSARAGSRRSAPRAPCA